MGRSPSATATGIRRRGLLKGAGSAIALGGGGTFFGAPFLSWPASAAITTYQAESARIYRGVLETVYSGFSGSAYVNTNQEAGSYVEWLVTVPQAVTATLIIRFANGSTANRPMAVRVNGAVVKPGETFSLNGHTGPRGPAQGYVEAAVIEDLSRTVRAIGADYSQTRMKRLNQQAASALPGPVQLEIVPGATHLFGARSSRRCHRPRHPGTS